jgi:uncharacterized protein (TIGR04141 family)
MSATAFTICLLKETIGSFDQALDPDKERDAYDLNEAAGLSGTLFVGKQTQFTPAWVNLLNPYLTNPVKGAFTASISAVLLITYANRLFAVCFGYGKSLLEASSWIRDFGLKVALNRVDPEKLRSIDTKTYEDLVVSTRQQTSKSSGISSFGLDVGRDLMRAVTGLSKDTTFFTRLTGSDSIHLTTELPFADFGDLLDELLVAYQDEAYKAHFEWIDNIKEVDAAVKEELDELLLHALRERDLEQMHLAPADVVDWEHIEGFNYPGGGKLHYQELDLVNYLDILGDEFSDLTVERLKHHKVRVRFEGSDEFREPWSIYDCLVWETDHNGRKYVLFDGRWFEVERTYAGRVEAYANSLLREVVQLPDAESGLREGEYNEAVADDFPNVFALLDQKLVRALNAATSIEFCDLLSSGREIIHIKKRSSSAALSHLFSQASVSCEAFLQDREMRKQLRQKLKAADKDPHVFVIPLNRPLASDYDVVYVILTEDKGHWPPALPFFSAVNLMHHASRIRNLGFDVSLQYVRRV